MFKIFQRNNVELLSKSIVHKASFLKYSKRAIYYDNLEVERNLDFIFNLGYNTIPSKIKPEISFSTLLNFVFKRKLNSMMKKRFKNLLDSIEKGDLEIMDNTLEDNIRYVLFKDLKKFYEQNCSIKLINKNEPIYLKILNVYEMENVNCDRSLNGEISDKDLIYLGKSKIVLSKYDPMREIAQEGKNLHEIYKEKEDFEKSEFREFAFDKLKETTRQNFNFQYAKDKIGIDANEKNIEYISNLIGHLEKSENLEDPYSKQVKIQFNDYYINREAYIKDKLATADLFTFFRTSMKSEYKSFLRLYEVHQGIFKRMLNSFRKKLFKRYVPKSQRISKEKTLYVIDVEISSKMRIEIINENNENVLDSIYNYRNKIKRHLNIIQNNTEYLNYDTGLYKFSVPDKKWDYNHEEFMQTHLVRFEFEKTNTLRNIFRKPYDTLVITDIDLCLKGNKHFKFTKNFL